jgi:hypothetical protein
MSNNNKIEYKIFKLLDNGQIKNNNYEYGFCYADFLMNKDEIEALLNKFWEKCKCKIVVTKITKQIKE